MAGPPRRVLPMRQVGVRSYRSQRKGGHVLKAVSESWAAGKGRGLRVGTWACVVVEEVRRDTVR